LEPHEERQLRSWAQGFDLHLSHSQAQAIGLFLDELLLWSRKMNLTGLSSREGIMRELLLDSLIPCPHLPAEGRLLDVGTGAGFPGLAIKICKPELEVDLVEANAKKASFLRQVIRITKLTGVKVIRERIERGGDLLNPEGYGIITARALASLGQTLTWCVPFLEPGGLMVTFSGAQAEAALAGNAEIIERQGLRLHKSIPYRLPGKEAQRHVIIFKKTGG
jgi:16S rRNA (guanine527-N7)-methyltransferase